MTTVTIATAATITAATTPTTFPVDQRLPPPCGWDAPSAPGGTGAAMGATRVASASAPAPSFSPPAASLAPPAASAFFSPSPPRTSSTLVTASHVRENASASDMPCAT